MQHFLCPGLLYNTRESFLHRIEVSSKCLLVEFLSVFVLPKTTVIISLAVISVSHFYIIMHVLAFLL